MACKRPCSLALRGPELTLGGKNRYSFLFFKKQVHLSRSYIPSFRSVPRFVSELQMFPCICVTEFLSLNSRRMAKKEANVVCSVSRSTAANHCILQTCYTVNQKSQHVLSVKVTACAPHVIEKGSFSLVSEQRLLGCNTLDTENEQRGSSESLTKNEEAALATPGNSLGEWECSSMTTTTMSACATDRGEGLTSEIQCHWRPW